MLFKNLELHIFVCRSTQIFQELHTLHKMAH